MKKIILNIVKNAKCKILWCLILCKVFNFIPDPFIRKFIEDEFYKYIYRPIFNYAFNKAIHFINYSWHKVREEFKYILRRLW